jgi:hypothetical protein
LKAGTSVPAFSFPATCACPFHSRPVPASTLQHTETTLDILGRKANNRRQWGQTCLEEHICLTSQALAVGPGGCAGVGGAVAAGHGQAVADRVRGCAVPRDEPWEPARTGVSASGRRRTVPGPPGAVCGGVQRGRPGVLPDAQPRWSGFGASFCCAESRATRNSAT